MLARALRIGRRFVSDGEYRQMLRMRMLPPKGGFQPFNHTEMDRYPEVFARVAEEFGADARVRILSFGCSTGEEVISLRRYLPNAAIRGIDMNPANIARCRALPLAAEPGIEFAVAKSMRGEADASYDAIFCMAVLRDGRLAQFGMEQCERYVRFADFAHIVEDFRRCLRPGGLLAIAHSNFRLCDAPAGSSFETVLRGGERHSQTPIFGPDNRLMPGIGYDELLFRRIA